MKHIILILLTITVFASCVRTLQKVDETPKSNKPVSEIQASNQFDWKTTRPIEVNITGIPNGPNFKSTLQIIQGTNSTLYTGNYAINTNLILNLEVPTTLENLTLTYGSLDLLLEINNDKVSYEFVTGVDNGSDD